jgi:hypothetical protein
LEGPTIDPGRWVTITEGDTVVAGEVVAVVAAITTSHIKEEEEVEATMMIATRGAGALPEVAIKGVTKAGPEVSAAVLHPLAHD